MIIILYLHLVNGDKAPNGYYLFSITVELDKRIEPRRVGGVWRGGERVYVKEVNPTEKTLKAAPLLTRTSDG